MSKDTYYFSHDYNARHDRKVKNLLSKLGVTGYGIFWSIIEDLYNNTNVLRLDYDSISYDLRCDKKKVISVINDFELFVIDGEFFSSLSVKKRLDGRNEKSAKARESVLKRWTKDTNVLLSNNDSNTIKERKGKERKSIKAFVPPEFSEFEKYCEEHGFKNIADRAFKGYSAASWHDTQGNPVKNWKQKLQNVWFSESNKKINKPQREGQMTNAEGNVFLT